MYVSPSQSVKLPTVYYVIKMSQCVMLAVVIRSMTEYHKNAALLVVSVFVDVTRQQVCVRVFCK